MSDVAELNFRWAYALLDGLASTGVRHAVISPGSRSTPLVLACDRHEGIVTKVQVDERCAAFYALGMARITQRPVVLISTSGSAPAHWHAAVIEAHQSGIPLLLLSADRPPALQGCGANQAIDQSTLFGSALRAYHALPVANQGEHDYVHSLAVRAAHQSRWPLPGPVQINVPFEEPLVPTRLPPVLPSGLQARVEQPTLVCPAGQLERVAARLSAGLGVIVCGPGDFDSAFADAVARLARELDCPLLADPLSGLRCGGHDRSHIITRYDAFLRSPGFVQQHRPEWVLRFGAMPVSKALSEYLLALEPGSLLLVDPGGRWLDPQHRVGEMLRGSPQAVCEGLLESRLSAATGVWWADFYHQEQRAALRAPVPFVEPAQTEPPWFEADLVTTLLDALPADSLLFCGNSMPIRDLDSFSGSRTKLLRCFANRGASGIDGQVSTLLGIADTAESSTTVAGLIGDLSFYHDMNGLLAARDSNATLVVVNNGGGGIFRYLPQAGLDAFKDYWLTPTALDMRHVAALYRLRLQRAGNIGEFKAALQLSLTRLGMDLIEAVIDPHYSVERHRAYWDAVGHPEDS